MLVTLIAGHQQITKMSSQPLSQAAANCSHNDEVKIPAAIVYTINNAFHSM